jgi:hypothetical protein
MIFYANQISQNSQGVTSVNGLGGDVVITLSSLGGAALSGATFTGMVQFGGTTHAGLRLNNLTTSQRDAIGSPEAGMILWNTTTSRANMYTGSAWSGGWVRLEGDTMTGPLAIASGSVSVSTPLLNLSQTWTAAVTFTGIRLDITDITSSSNSMLMDLQVGGASRASVTKAGHLTSISMQSRYISFDGWWTASQTAQGGISFGSGHSIAWGSGTTNVQVGAVSGDLFLLRDAADTLAIRRSTNAQAFRWYRSFTDASNFTRGALQTTASTIEIAAESAGTGLANIDVALTPKGTGRVRFGSHSAIGAETITGFIEMKDSSGANRKLAVVS